MLSDLRYAHKWLVRSPGFAAVAILSLAIGIGFNTALFSIVDAVLFRPLAVDHPERLVSIYTKGGAGDKYGTSSYPDYIDFRDRNAVFSDIVAFTPAITAVRAG